MPDVVFALGIVSCDQWQIVFTSCDRVASIQTPVTAASGQEHAQERIDLRRAHVVWMLEVVSGDEGSNSVGLGLLGL